MITPTIGDVLHFFAPGTEDLRQENASPAIVTDTSTDGRYVGVTVSNSNYETYHTVPLLQPEECIPDDATRGHCRWRSSQVATGQ